MSPPDFPELTLIEVYEYIVANVPSVLSDLPEYTRFLS